MLTPDPIALRRSRTRWYFGGVGLIGLIAIPAQLSLDVSMAWQVLLACGVPLMIAYLAAAIAFPRLERGPWLPRIAGAMVLWSLAIAVMTALDGGPGRAVLPTILVVIPAVTVVMRLTDAKS